MPRKSNFMNKKKILNLAFLWSMQPEFASQARSASPAGISVLANCVTLRSAESSWYFRLTVLLLPNSGFPCDGIPVVLPTVLKNGKPIEEDPNELR